RCAGHCSWFRQNTRIQEQHRMLLPCPANHPLSPFSPPFHLDLRNSARHAMIRAEMVDMGPEWRSKVKVPLLLRGVFCLLIGALLTVAPFFYYRYAYTFAKRLRVVDAGLIYRSGCMTSPGFREALARYHIRTVLNVNDEAPDPDLAEGYFTANSIRE